MTALAQSPIPRSHMASNQTERLFGMLRTMMVIREFEEAARQGVVDGLVHGSVHESIGQEGVAVGVCSNLQKDDLIHSNHRGHGHAIAKGADPRAMMMELFGRAGGTCGGKGGSMHIADFSVGMLGANGILADGVTMGVGAAHGLTIMDQRKIVAIFVGDGTTNRGPFYEGLNWAKVFNLPVLFICEDNLYASSTITRKVTAGQGPMQRARAFDIPAVSVDGNDVIAVDRATQELTEAIRDGRGPQFLHAVTYRIRGHISRDTLAYREKEETERYWAKEPIGRLEAYLVAEGVAAADIAAVRAEARQIIAEAVEAAKDAPYPDDASAFRDVQDVGGAGMSEITFTEAVRQGLAEEMRRDPRVWALGEDLSTSPTSAHYYGLIEEFGDKRIVNTPISESTIMGAAIGAAVVGTRPVAELRNVDFGLCAIDELVNQGAKIRYMFGGQARVPLVVRQTVGVRRGAAAQHCGSYEAWFVHVPGLVVVTPATPADGKGLLKSSIRCNDPVVFLEHKELWTSKGEVPEDPEFTIELGKARVVREGCDLTIVAWSRMVFHAEQAAAALAEEGISAEVIDLRTLWPWDTEAVLASVRKTRRLLVPQEAVNVGGFASEVCCHINEVLGGQVKVRRLGAPRIPVPYAPNLEDQFRIGKAHIAEAAQSMVADSV